MPENGVRSSGPRVIVALDYPDAKSALGLARRLNPQRCRVKVGFELFVSSGPSLIHALNDLGYEIFLDLKFHDIPNTVSAACRAAAALDVWMMNLHASGGRVMMEAAREAIEVRPSPPLLIGVTVLTSLESRDLEETGIHRDARTQVLELARLTQSCGLDGVVCSAQEAATLREACGDDFVLVTPGIRPASAASDDQKRVVTPREALEFGADYLVIGRPISRATDPMAALAAIADSLA